MTFTREDILKILNALLQLGRKDSEFKDANTPLNSDDYIAILLDGINKKVSINNLLSTLGLLKKDDFINVSDRYDEYYIQLSEAITIIAKNKRKNGLIITFLDLQGNWKIYQFNGELNDFINTNYWKDLFDFKYPIIGSILPDEEDLTLTYPDNSNNSFIKLKDRTSDSYAFSGTGYKILRKNIVNGENILTQDMINQPNTIYEIRYDFNLNEQEIVIPEGCILQFNGGSFSNGTLKNPYIIKGEFEKLNCNIIGSHSFIPNQVSYSQFGAKLDGVNDDYYFIKKCHDFANKYKLDVVQEYGNIYIGKDSDSIIIQTNTDISKCTLVADNNSFVKNTYLIDEDDNNKPIDISTIYTANKSEFSFGASTIPCLKGLEPSLFIIKSSNKALGVRPSVATYYCAEPFVIYHEGAIVDGSLYCDYSQSDCKATLTYKKINTKKILIKLPNIYLNRTNGIPENLFLIQRNNTEVIMPNNISYSANYIDPLSTRYFIKFTTCYGCNIQGSGNAPLKNVGHRIGTDNKSSNYIIATTYSSFMTYDNLVTYNGWGAYNTEFVKTIYFKNSICNRFDNHFGISDLFIQNCTFIGNAGKINIGYGVGNVYIDGIKLYSYEANTQGNTCVLLDFRCDLRLFYRGNVILNNAKCVVNTNSLTLVQLYNSYKNCASASSVHTNNIVESIKLKDIFINNNGNIVYGLNILNQYESYPLDIKKIEFENINSDKFILFNNYTVDDEPPIIQNITIKDTDIYDYNVKALVTNNLIIYNDSIVKVLKNIANNATYYNCHIRYINEVNNIYNTTLYNCLVEPGLNSAHTLLQLKSLNINMFHCTITKRSDYPDINSLAFLIEGTKGVFIGNKKDDNLTDAAGFEYDNKKLAFHITKDLFSNAYSKYNKSAETLITFDYVNNRFVAIKDNIPYYTDSYNNDDMKKTGTFTNKPINPIVGFSYFCTDKNTTEGTTNGIMIYHKGNNVWVDALGRVVS